MVTLTADEFFQALEDPIAPQSRRLIENANSTYAKEIRKLYPIVFYLLSLCSLYRCLKYGGIRTQEAFIFGLDHLGMDIMGQDEEGIFDESHLVVDDNLR